MKNYYFIPMLLLISSCTSNNYDYTKFRNNPDNIIKINANAATNLRDKFTNFSIGSDYPGTLIRNDSLQQLAKINQDTGFKYIRFHAIFHDDMGVFKLVNGKPHYNWSKIDYLYDTLLKMGIKPFVELGFTPLDMRTSDLSIFYWKGNTSHPKFDLWEGLVKEFIIHLQERYGKAEVETWFFEVWNEPNLDGFWENADKDKYFKLYEISAKAIKSINPNLKVGGPSTAGAAWVPEFIEYGKKTNSPVDFVTTHTYGVAGGFLDEKGESDNKLVADPKSIINDVEKVRNEMIAAGHEKTPLYFTEWSTSYNPRDPIHDSYISAAYILDKLKGVEGKVQGMSYWTYSDLFEEPGPQIKPFDGGFGLVNPQGIPKASYFAYKYLNELGDDEIKIKNCKCYITKKGNNIKILAWNYTTPNQNESNRPFFTKLQIAKDIEPFRFEISGLPKQQYIIKTKRTGFKNNDPQSTYIELGMPSKLSDEEFAKIQATTKDLHSESKNKLENDGKLKIKVPMKENDVILIDISPE